MITLELLLILTPLAFAVVLLATTKGLRGATLIAPRNWAIFAMACHGAASYVLLSRDDPTSLTIDVIRYLAGIAMLSPFMALLGAKRPQNRGWQFVVATLLVVLALPALNALIYGGVSRLQLPGLIGWLLWGLIAFEVANFLFTRMAIAVVGVALAQMAALTPFLPGTPNVGAAGGMTDTSEPIFACVVAVVGAVVPAAMLRWRLRRAARESRPRTFPGLWSEFRALFGATWALRIVVVFNNGAEANEWPLRLTWGGVEPSAGREQEPVAEDVANAMAQSIRMLLRRFVSPEWMEERWDGSWDAGEGKLVG